MEKARAHLSNAISWMNCCGYEKAWDSVKVAVELFKKHGETVTESTEPEKGGVR